MILDNNIDIYNVNNNMSLTLYSNAKTISEILIAISSSIDEYDKYQDLDIENLKLIRNTMLELLISANNNGYLIFFIDPDNQIINDPTFKKFNLKPFTLYFFLNVVCTDTELIQQFMYLIPNCISSGNLMLLYSSDFLPIFETLDYLIIHQPFNIINETETVVLFEKNIITYQVILENIRPYVLRMQLCVGKIDVEKIIETITQKIIAELAKLKCDIIKIICRLYLKIFITTSNKLYTCLSYTNYKTSNFVTDFIEYKTIPNINYNLLPNKFVYDNEIYEYYRHNNILYLKISNNVYFRKKKTNYKIIDGVELVDDLNTFKYLREIYFKDSNIINSLIDIKNLLNEIYDGLIIKYLDNKIYFYEIAKDDNLITKNIICKKKIILIQIIDISYFFSINNNWIDVRDVWEIYYSPEQNLLIKQKLQLLIDSIEKLLMRLFYGCGCGCSCRKKICNKKCK